MVSTLLAVLALLLALLNSGSTVKVPATQILEVSVGPELVDCVGVGPRKCMVVDGGFFYDGIRGFDYEEGYHYRLRIERFEAYPGQEPPQDASKYGYRLIEVLSKTPAQGDG